jgi:hypothetical protein
MHEIIHEMRSTVRGGTAPARGEEERMAKTAGKAAGRARSMAVRRAKRLVKRLAIVTVLIPLVAWVLDEAARRSDARNQASPWGQRLHQGSEWVSGFGRGPLANRLRRPQG